MKFNESAWLLYTNKPGWDVAEQEISACMYVAKTMADLKSAMVFIGNVLQKHSRYGATDTAVRETIEANLENHFFCKDRHSAYRSTRILQNELNVPASTCATKDVAEDALMRNNLRAEWAAHLLSTYMKESDASARTVVRDLLCDLQHLCDRLDLDFEKELQAGRMFYSRECNKVSELNAVAESKKVVDTASLMPHV